MCVSGHAALCRPHHLSGGVTQPCADGDIVLLPALNFHLNPDRGTVAAHFGRGDEHSVAGDVCRVGHFQPDVAEESASGVPARTFLRACRGVDGHDVVGVITQMFRHVGL